MFNGKIEISEETRKQFEELEALNKGKTPLEIMLENSNLGGLTEEESNDLMTRLNPDITSDEIEEAINKEDEEWEESDEYKQYREALFEEFRDFDFDFDSLTTQGED